jgi:chaperonin GroEL
MAYGKQKTAAKTYISEPQILKDIVLRTMEKVSNIVGSSLGTGGKLTLLESDLPNIPNRLSKDGVSIFKSLGAANPYEHLIIESARDAAVRTASTAGDGTTTATILSYHIIKNIFAFCENNPKYSPQKAVRRIRKVLKDILVPYIRERAIKITEENKDLLLKVATISANGDKELAEAVITAFELIGYGESSHITIRQLTGPDSYDVKRIDGMPIPIGLEESCGKFHTVFISDQAGQRAYLEKPLFLLFDGVINDLVSVGPMFDAIGEKYASGDADFKNLVLVSHGFSDNVLTGLSFNFANPQTINILPLKSPMAQFLNSQQQWLMDLSAFTGAKIFGLKDQLSTAKIEDLGTGMQSFEAYRFRSTVVGDPEPMNIEVRADTLKKMKENAESQAERMWLEERLGVLTSGIAKLTVYGGSSGDITERVDRIEDATMAVKSAITHGVLPGGCRISLDMAVKLMDLPENDPAREVLFPSLIALPEKLLDNSGYNEEEIKDIIDKLIGNPELVYDLETESFGDPFELGLFDASKAVEDSLNNSISISGVLGCMGGIVAFPRDVDMEREEFRKDKEFMQICENPHQYKNEANERP